MSDRWRAIQNPWWDHPDTVAWRENVAALIEAVRLDDAPSLCPTCGCAAHLPERRCSQCQVVKPITQFNRDRRLPLGRIYQCKTCRRPQRRQRYIEEKIRMFRQAVRGVAV